MTLQLEKNLFQKKVQSSKERETVLKKAVEFLENENVRKTALRRRIIFLKSKGLTTEEISEAFCMANQSIEIHQIEDAVSEIPGSTISISTRQNDRKWSIHRYIAYSGMGICSALGVYQAYQWITQKYKILICPRKIDEKHDMRENMSKGKTDPESELASLHSELARSKAEARKHLQHVDKLLLEKEKLERDGADAPSPYR